MHSGVAPPKHNVMFFTKYKAFRLPNEHYQVILFPSRKLYGNVIGVNKGVAFEFTHKNFITVWKKILLKHKRVHKTFGGFVK